MPTLTPTPARSVLDASGYLVHKGHFVSLTWSGALGALVNACRDGVLISMTANDEQYLMTHHFQKKKKGQRKLEE
jgi:hypothetical protein